MKERERFCARNVTRLSIFFSVKHPAGVRLRPAGSLPNNYWATIGAEAAIKLDLEDCEVYSTSWPVSIVQISS